MTRVEKYRLYRKEILNSFYVDEKETKKKKSSELVSKITVNRDATNNISYDEVLEAYEIYDKNDIQNKKHRLNAYQKKQISFIIISVSIIILLLAALIIVGIFAFGG